MAGKHWDDFTETRIIEAEKWLYMTLCSFRGILFTPNLLVLFFPLLVWQEVRPTFSMTPLCLVWHLHFRTTSPLQGEGCFWVLFQWNSCWSYAESSWHFLALGSASGLVSASTRDVQIFTDVTVLVSLPECFTSGYWKVRCLFVMLFTTCYMMGCGGVLFKSRDTSVTEVSLLVQFLSIITEAWPFYNKW